MRAPFRLRVMTFNIHGGRPRVGPADLPAVARVIAEQQPDLVALQEVHRYLPRPYVFADQPRELRRLLGLETRFLPSFGMGPLGYGNAVLSRPRPARVQRWGLPSGLERRALLQARFSTAGVSFCFFNTHLGLRTAERLAQIRVVAERVRRAGLPVILAGDLNAGPESEELRLLQEAGLEHCLPPEVLTFPCDRPHCRLDYLLVSPLFQVERAFIVETEVSDHLPVVADLVLT